MVAFQRVLLLPMLVAGLVYAQGTTSRVTGTVVDPSGAPIPGVVVKLISEETNLAFEVKTADSGVYLFDSVRSGLYTVSVEAQGFKKFVSRENRVQIGQPATVDVRLEVGNIVDVVDVVETAQQVQTSSSSNLGNTLSERTIRDIPIVGARGRNILTALNVQPGVVNGGNTGGGVHVNGARDRSWNYTLDGIDINETSAGGSNSSPVRTNPDMLQEFRVITSNPSAEYGRNSGGTVAMVSSSGSNQFKGSLFWFYRTPRLNANEWENNFNRVGKRNFVQNIGGVSIGGPIFKNKTFFFYNIQGLAATQTQVTTSTVYTATARQGLLRYVAGGQNGAAGTPNAAVDFNGNVLPGRAISTYNVVTSDPARRGLDPTVQAMIQKTPLPNRFDVGDGLNTAGYVFAADEAERQRDQNLRIDHVINAKNTIFGRYTWGYANTLCDSVNGGLRRFPDAVCTVDTNRKTYNAVANWRSNPSPNITNELVAGWNQFYFGFPNPFFDLGRSTFTAPNSLTLPEVYTFNNERTLKTAQLVENFSWLRGNHAIKMGGNFRYQQHLDTRGTVGGVNVGQQVNFDRTVNVVDPTAFGLPNDINVAVDRPALESNINFLLGRVGTVSRAFVAGTGNDQFVADTFKFDARFPEYDFYIQDSWKVRKNLTIDYGLRYEWKGTPSNPDNRIFRPNQTVTAGSAPSTTLRWTPGQLYGNQNKNFGPSVGFAWDPFGNGKTSIRGNYRLAFDRITTFVLSSFVFPNTPGTSIGVVNRTFGQNGGRLSEVTNLAPPTQRPSELAQPTAYSDASVTAVDPGLQTPKTNMWTLSIQREVARRTVVEATYIGRRAYNLMGAYNVNQAEIFRNGFLDAFNTVRAGGESALMNNLLRADTRVRAGETGSQFIRRQFLTSVNNGSVAFIANQLSRFLVSGQNLPAASGFSPSFFNPYPQFGGGLTVIDSNDWSTYHALQLSINRQFSSGASVYAVYTLSKSLDTRSFDPTFTTASAGAVQSASSTPFDIFNRRLNYALSDFDRTHVLQSTFVYDLPFGRGQKFGGTVGPMVNRLIGGWQLRGMFRATSGRPFSVFSGENSFSSAVGAFADCNGCTRQDGQARVENGFMWYFSPEERAKFVQPATGPAPGSLGNTGRNFFRGDIWVNLDMSFAKNTRITERIGFEIRADMTNFTNTPTFGIPTTTVTSATFGRIGGTVSSTARQTMLGAKLTF
ncbi:hypothetical protein F183_A01820 [Bryobacterales bacterium F-183]|nr:hypothetical protein F183_A01820 [Bryobacterales bacterium F-183]